MLKHVDLVGLEKCCKISVSCINRFGYSREQTVQSLGHQQPTSDLPHPPVGQMNIYDYHRYGQEPYYSRNGLRTSRLSRRRTDNFSKKVMKTNSVDELSRRQHAYVISVPYENECSEGAVCMCHVEPQGCLVQHAAQTTQKAELL